ncbi:MAG: 4-hydroxy-tetrahydrodipicolinate synthase [Nanoarchaeota archaeon]|nr:4-hydroxy-tetrahydrodipicolinate synthase [Nanoarchaeota archaeon]
MIEGAFTALVTPIRSDEKNLDGKVNFDLIPRLVEYNLNNGIDGIVPSGCTGQSFTLDDDEQVRITKTVAEASKDKTVMAGDGSNKTKSAIDLVGRVEREAGVYFHMQITPYANKPDPEGIFDYYSTIAKNISGRIILYNVPGRTGIDLTSDKYYETIVELAKIENIIALKEASGNLEQVKRIIKATKNLDFAVFSGDDKLTLDIIKEGGKGVISVASNVAPAMVSDMVHYALNNKYDKAEELDNRLKPLYKALFIQNNPQCVHYALRKIGFNVGVPRLPLHDINAESKSIIDEALKSVGE